jgi:ubiquinone/menaquinone biosynthesis C-methylase UbiE
MEGYVNVDWSADAQPDIVHDLNSLPLPFSDNSVDEVYMSHCLEHLERPFNVMRDIHRILKPGGIADIRVPHFSRGMTHPEHTHGFDVTFPVYFNPVSPKGHGYMGCAFELVSMQLRWEAFARYLHLVGYGKITIFTVRVVGSIINFFANLSPFVCSRIWCFWVGGFNEIHFVFRKPAQR